MSADPFGNNGTTEADEIETDLEAALLQKLIAGCVTSRAFKRLKRFLQAEPIIGDWLKERDIGFIFAARGVGKTFFAMNLAKSIAAQTVRTLEIPRRRVWRST